MVFHCPRWHDEALGDLGVREAFAEQVEDVELPGREPGRVRARRLPWSLRNAQPKLAHSRCRARDEWLCAEVAGNRKRFGECGFIVEERQHESAVVAPADGIATMWCYVTQDRARADAVLADVPAPMLNRPVEQLRAILPIGSAEKLMAYALAGAQRVFLWPLADERAQLEVFRERVVPLLDAERT